jgi:hypothetical protein
MSTALTEQASVSLRNYQPKMADNVLNHVALLKYLKDKGKIENDTGGRDIVEGLMYAENSTAKWFNGLESFNIVEEEVLGSATFDRKYLAAFVYFSLQDKTENRGKHQIHSLIKNRIKVAEKTLMNNVGLSLYSDGTGSNSKELGGLQLLVDDDPTSAGTVGGINQVNETWWRNQYQAAQAITSANIRSVMNIQWLSQVRGTDKPDLILADDDMFNHYESSLQENIRYTTAKSADAGFEHIRYKSADVVFDDNCPDKHMYFLNCDYLTLRCDPSQKFSVGKPRQVTNAFYEVIPVQFSGALTTSNRSLQGVFQAS